MVSAPEILSTAKDNPPSGVLPAAPAADLSARPVFDVSYPADGDFTKHQFCVMALTPGSSTVCLCDWRMQPLGVLQNTPLPGEEAIIRVLGLTPVETCASVVRGDTLHVHNGPEGCAGAREPHLSGIPFATAVADCLGGEYVLAVVSPRRGLGEGEREPSGSAASEALGLGPREVGILDLSFIAEEDLSGYQYRAVSIGHSEETVRLQRGKYTGVGVLQNAPRAGEVAFVRLMGISRVAVSDCAEPGCQLSIAEEDGLLTFSVSPPCDVLAVSLGYCSCEEGGTVLALLCRQMLPDWKLTVDFG